MYITKLRVQNFRNHHDFSCDFSPRTTLIYGMNGAGKTSLLEAIYLVYTGKSFKGLSSDILRSSSEWFRVDIYADASEVRTVTFDDRGGRKRKDFTIDDTAYARLPRRYHYPVVLFTPDDMRLIDGSPSRRRRYIDDILSRHDTGYAMHLRRYERALQQRNRLIREPRLQADTLFSWNIILSESGSYIINARQNLMDSINEKIQDYYAHITHSEETVSVAYSHKSTTPSQLLGSYEESLEQDVRSGNTTVGPHRHDFMIYLRDKQASSNASRGECRTLVLCLKYIEADIMRKVFNERPIVLLDDVFGELDETRQKNLLDFFVDNQVIITSTTKHKADRIVSIHQMSTE